MLMFGERQAIRVKVAKKYDLDGLSRRYFNPGELETYLHLLDERQPKVVIEFGVNEGRTPLAALRNISSIEEYFGIDVLPGYRTIKEVQRKEVPANPGHFVKEDPRFKLILSENGSFDLVPEDLPIADVIFIDADHSRQGVLNDYRLALQCLNDDGLIIFHDDNNLKTVDVTETLDDLERHRREGDPRFVHVDKTWFCLQDWKGNQIRKDVPGYEDSLESFLY